MTTVFKLTLKDLSPSLLLCLLMVIGADTQNAKLNLNLVSPNMKVITFGQRILYSVSIHHDQASTANANSLRVIIYIPRFFTAPTVPQNGNLNEIKALNGSLEVKIEGLKNGESISFDYDIYLSEVHNKKLEPGFHFAVTEGTLLWKSESTKGEGVGTQTNQSSFAFELPGCSYNLGIDSGRIRGHQLTASSSSPASQPSQARYSDDGWCAGAEQYANQYIQVYFAKKTRVTMVTTWARSRKAHWITKYTLEFSDDGSVWYPYKESGFTKVFEGNKDTINAVSHKLRYTVGFNFMRIRPIAWNILICFRFELFGCEVGKYDNCVDAIGMENGLIPYNALTNSKGKSDGLDNGRLNKRVVNFPFGWQADSAISDDFMQIDLGSVHKVTRIATQGSDNEPAIFFVMSYLVSYSNNSLEWAVVQENDKDKEFTGHNSYDSAQFPKVENIIPPVYARYVRLIPKNFKGLKVLRAEIYGCMSEPVLTNTTYKAVPKELGRRVVLLDRKRNIFYVCVYKDELAEKSCFYTSDGKIWEEIKGVVNVIGYDDGGAALYGIDSHLSYKFSPDAGERWVAISEEEWARRQTISNIVAATRLKDILVGTVPNSTFQFEGSNGKLWGVSGQGVHLKEADKWQLVASWKCCGF